jgi:hypothetical protein
MVSKPTNKPKTAEGYSSFLDEIVQVENNEPLLPVPAAKTSSTAKKKRGGQTKPKTHHKTEQIIIKVTAEEKELWEAALDGRPGSIVGYGLVMKYIKDHS